jgi:hypothetical protein
MTLRDWAARTSPHYGEIRAPVVVVAGTDDKARAFRAPALDQRVPLAAHP